MNPTELSLFTAREQTLLVATEPARLTAMSEDELADLLVLVRRARNKHTGLHRRQGAATVQAARKRSATATSNVRTARKAEIFEDALARVARQLSVAARATASELKRERLDAARGERQGPATVQRGAAPKGSGAKASGAKGSGKKASGNKGSRTTSSGPVTARRVASTRATNARRQATRDAR